MNFNRLNFTVLHLNHTAAGILYMEPEAHLKLQTSEAKTLTFSSDYY